MKTILEFTLPDEREELRCAQEGQDWRATVEEMANQLRTWAKHGHEFKTIAAALDGARGKLFEIIEGRGLSLD